MYAYCYPTLQQDHEGYDSDGPSLDHKNVNKNMYNVDSTPRYLYMTSVITASHPPIAIYSQDIKFNKRPHNQDSSTVGTYYRNLGY